MYQKKYNKETEILELYTRGFNKEYYVREIARLLKISPRTAQLTLENLEKKTILRSTARGKIKLYKLQKTQAAREYLTITEIHKKVEFFDRHLVIKEIAEKISPHIKGMALIFGSYAKGKEKKDSDLDIFIVGKCESDRIREISKTYNHQIQIHNYPLEIFKKNVQDDILIKEVLENHIAFLNAEQFIEIIWTKLIGA